VVRNWLYPYHYTAVSIVLSIQLLSWCGRGVVSVQIVTLPNSRNQVTTIPPQPVPQSCGLEAAKYLKSQVDFTYASRLLV
jgi:hypothetical protein